MAGRRKLGSASLKTGRLIWPCLAGERGPDGRGKWPYAMLEDRLTEHLNTVDDEAQERMDILVRQMMDRQGITEELKVRDQMEWIRAVNGIRNMAEEIVLNELIYR